MKTTLLRRAGSIAAALTLASMAGCYARVRAGTRPVAYGSTTVVAQPQPVAVGGGPTVIIHDDDGHGRRHHRHDRDVRFEHDDD